MGFSGIFFSYKPDFVIDPDHKVLAFIDYDRKKMLVSTKMSGRFAVAQWKRAFGAEHVQKFSKEDQATSEMFSVISTPKGFSILVCDELNEFYMKKYHTDFVIAKKTNFKTDDKRVLIIDQLPKNMGCMIFCDKNGFHLMFSGK
ncbi:hypothetical protein HYD_1860 [Candidatus Hydrogenosomobacter endosymbioticus]|uniref:Uncharacterized protein n=2 Tax=Candidatus Hydrogenosomobacter endosymbioticus TaxID=2558174 RepID=A0ABM7V976_9PROT|nr:hypothetical protein HYD_1860 [Candidatus Hydrogenosomobacter endosymbioticus]